MTKPTQSPKIDASTFAPVKARNDKVTEKQTGTVGKLTIGSLDEPDVWVEAQFNQKELEITRNIPWAKPPEAGKQNGKGKTGVNLEFGGAEGRSLSLDLLFDSYEAAVEDRNVAANVKKLEQLASVRDPKSKEEQFKRPHRCIVVWGDTLMGGDKREDRGIKCVIESLSIKYTMFSPDGAPLRAQCTVKLKEAEGPIGTAKKK